MNGVINHALFTGKYSFEYLVLILFTNGELEIPLAYGAAENIEELAPHKTSSLMSMIWVISGPVEIRVTGQPISASACRTKSFAFLVSFP